MRTEVGECVEKHEKWKDVHCEWPFNRGPKLKEPFQNSSVRLSDVNMFYFMTYPSKFVDELTPAKKVQFKAFGSVVLSKKVTV